LIIAPPRSIFTNVADSVGFVSSKLLLLLLLLLQILLLLT
jgi:hypothetical protein